MHHYGVGAVISQVMENGDENLYSQHTLLYRKECDISKADALSKILLKETISTSVPLPGDILRLVNLQ